MDAQSPFSSPHFTLTTARLLQYGDKRTRFLPLLAAPPPFYPQEEEDELNMLSHFESV